jgi:ribonuclease Z
MELTFLGTGCMSPTKERNHQAIFLTYRNEGLLFDCGEGTQRQFFQADIKVTKITKMFISHWHGDHVLGIPGLLQTLNNSDYSGTLEIFGPKGIKENIDGLLKVYDFSLVFDHRITEIKDGDVIETSDYAVAAVGLEHSVECLGFSFVEKDRLRIKLPFIKKKGIPEGPLLGKLQDGQDIEWKGEKIKAEDATYPVKGKKISFVMDTVLCNGCNTLAKDADILVCESVYTKKYEDKAEEYKHMTAEQAGLLASRSNVDRLILTHFSQRFKTTEELCEEAKTVFDNTICAFDFMKVKP